MAGTAKAEGERLKQFSLVGHYLAQAVESPGAWIGGVVVLVGKTLMPTTDLAGGIIALLLLCLMDALLAVIHAQRSTPRIAITSKRFTDGVFKLVAYFVALASVSVMKLASPSLLVVWNAAIWLVLGLFAARELLSVAEHLEAFGVSLPKKLIRILKGIEKDADKGTLKAEEVS